MQQLVLLLITVVMTFGYLAKSGLLPRFAPYLFEICAGIALLYVIVAGVRNQFRFVHPKYWIALGSVLLVMTFGAILNHLEPGPLFSGLRNYLRIVPLFLLPAAISFTDAQVKTQLRLLLALCLIQAPIALSQRIATRARGGITGDETTGTLGDSSFLSVFLVCGICVLTALALRKQIKPATFLILFILFIFPTTINETKATFVFIPIAMVIIFLIEAPPGRRARNLVLALGLMTVFAAIFVPTYDYLIQDRGKQGAVSLMDFFTEEGKVEGYLKKDASAGATKFEQTGRLDSVIVPLKVLSKDPAKLVFGLGIGNATNSALGPEFQGEYFSVLGIFAATTTAGKLVLEIGALGLFLVFTLFWMIFNDSRTVASTSTNTVGALASAWTGLIIVVALCHLYKEFINSDALSCMFWYLSGLIAAERMRLARQPVGQSVAVDDRRLYARRPIAPGHSEGLVRR